MCVTVGKTSGEMAGAGSTERATSMHKAPSHQPSLPLRQLPEPILDGEAKAQKALFPPGSTAQRVVPRPLSACHGSIFTLGPHPI